MELLRATSAQNQQLPASDSRTAATDVIELTAGSMLQAMSASSAKAAPSPQKQDLQDLMQALVDFNDKDF